MVSITTERNHKNIIRCKSIHAKNFLSKAFVTVLRAKFISLIVIIERMSSKIFVLHNTMLICDFCDILTIFDPGYDEL